MFNFFKRVLAFVGVTVSKVGAIYHWKAGRVGGSLYVKAAAKPTKARIAKAVKPVRKPRAVKPAVSMAEEINRLPAAKRRTFGKAGLVNVHQLSAIDREVLQGNFARTFKP